jgi:predicted MFS family arabinose efflux permease
MVQLRILGNRLFQRTMSVSLIFTAAFLGTLFTIPLFLQEGRGASPLESGLTVFPEAIGVVFFTQIVSRIYPRIGPRRTMMGGLIWITIILAILSTRDFETSLWTIRALMFALGWGMSCIFVSNQVAAMATISREDTGRASMLMSVQRQIGSATGVALISSVLIYVGTETVGASGLLEPNLTAYRTAFAFCAGLALTGVFLASRIPDADAAETMLPKTKPVSHPSPSPAD